MMTEGLLVAAVLAALVLLVLWLRARRGRSMAEGVVAALRTDVADRKSQVDEARQSLEGLRQRFSAVVEADAEAKKVRESSLAERQQAEAEIAALEGRIAAVRADYLAKKRVFDALAAQVAIFDEKVSFAELGIYEPHFQFDDSDQFKAEIERIRDRQKQMAAAKTAVVCDKEWSVDGNKAKGRQFSDRQIKLALRAFNNECEAAIANVRWNNANAMTKRIETAFAQINKLNETNAVRVTGSFLDLKLTELRLTHEYREKMKAEREERAELARAAREEAKLQRDLEVAEEQEAKYARLLAKAKEEAEGVVGPRLDAYQAKIEALEKDLADAHAKAERAQAMAERTKTGYVYIISNVGSFGPDTVKIGLTRRLDPLDRVRELGDASVPFAFDVHAIIYSDDAPGLERALHAEFAAGRINEMNFRKEFFKADLAQVQAAVARLAPGAPFFTDVEAQEYQETLAKRNAVLSAGQVTAQLLFPESI